MVTTDMLLKIEHLPLLCAMFAVAIVAFTEGIPPRLVHFHSRRQGAKCRYTGQCVHGTCCLLSGPPPPTCQNLAVIGRPCSSNIVRGVYQGHCPCPYDLRCIGHFCMPPPRAPPM
uniref:Ixodegrin B n=1 Tax=Rhipicephalus appendiculatus TaxID=34631 RepID=A0A131Z851_RHIAP